MFKLPKKTILGELGIKHTFQYYDVPRLFHCQNKSGSQYLALSIFDDYEKYEWLYLPLSSDRLSSLLSKRVDLRTAFVSPEDGFIHQVISNFSGDSQVETIFPEQIRNEDLPDEGIYLETSEKVLVGFGAIDAVDAALSTKRETLNLHLYPQGALLPELDVKEFGSILLSFQELADAIAQSCKGEPTLKGAIPAEIREEATFQATQVFEGSFGIQLKSKHIPNVLGESLASDILLEFTNLLELGDCEDKLSEKLHLLQGRVASKYRKLLKDITNLDSPLKIQWGSMNSERGKELTLSKNILNNTFALVSKIDTDMSESVCFKAELLGLDTAAKNYRVKDLSDGQVYRGKISDESLNQVAHSEINANYKVTLKKVIETNSSSGSENIKWMLIELKLLT